MVTLKNIIALALFLFCQQGIKAQRIYNIPIFPKGDTTLFYKTTRLLAAKMDLPDLTNSTDKFHFRFWTFGQALDIWVDDKNELSGQITNYAKVYNPDKKSSEEQKIFSNVVPLDRVKIIQVLNLLKQYKINEIPSDIQIPGWKWKMKGWNFAFETTTPREYTFKSYFTPMAQTDTVKGASAIIKFTDGLLLELNLNQVYTTLTTTLPEGKYVNDGYGILEIKKR